MSYAAILWFLCVLFLFLNLIDLFDNDNKGGYAINYQRVLLIISE